MDRMSSTCGRSVQSNRRKLSVELEMSVIVGVCQKMSEPPFLTELLMNIKA
jgi:hypothetical protein